MNDPRRTSIDPASRPRIFSETDCQDIVQRVHRAAHGGGYTLATIASVWHGSVRWARNRVDEAGEDRNAAIQIQRLVDGARGGMVEINQTTNAGLVAAARRAERLARLARAAPENDLIVHYVPEPATVPPLFHETTYQVSAETRVAVARQMAQTAADAGLLSAGYLQVSAHSLATLTSWGYTKYVQYTWAQVSVTVRDPQGTGSGWAGVDWPDWGKIDAAALMALACDKCLTSRNPVAIEPGRYTTILEPQAVCDFVGELVYGQWTPASRYQMLDRVYNELAADAPFHHAPARAGAGAGTTSRQDQFGMSQLGERVVDERITISADPLDPELGFPPFANEPWRYASAVMDDVYHPVTWIDHGVLTHLSYNRWYGLQRLGQNTGLPLQGAFRMSGGDTSLAEMIATTTRGLLVTRLDRITHLDIKTLLLSGYTRDGLWLIERGKIAKPVKNMVFTESLLFALNNVEQLGVPQRAFHPADARSWQTAAPQPVIVPPLKIRDFSFPALSSAV